MRVELTQNCKQLLPGLKSGRPTGSDSLPLFQINQDVNCVPRRLLLAEHFCGGGAGLLAVTLDDVEHARRQTDLLEQLGNAGSRWVKLEVLGDKATLLPDPVGTLEATKELVKDGFEVLVYSSEDPPTQRGIVEVDAVDGSILFSTHERNPEDWSQFAR